MSYIALHLPLTSQTPSQEQTKLSFVAVISMLDYGTKRSGLCIYLVLFVWVLFFISFSLSVAR